jgi:Mat/Ecp fimbriae major subunit
MSGGIPQASSVKASQGRKQMTRQAKNILIHSAVIAAAIFGLSAHAQAATATASATATILAPVQLTKTADLAFATIVTGSAADTVIVSSAGARSCGSNLTCSGAVAAAAFNVAGSASTSYAITLPGTVTISSGTNNMSVGTFTSSKAGNVSTLNSSGADSFTIGATLSVGANQAAGSYSGSFSVAVDYN